MKVKRIFDVLVSFSSIVFLLPLLLFICIIIFVQDGHNPFFFQKRVGQNGKEFTLLKFRSMPINTPNVPSTETNVLKVTFFGKIIRRTNFDELPQLLNILMGDMSVVGPRPALISQIELLDIRIANGSIKCRPGLTGLAQINAFDGMSIPEKANFDFVYSKQISFCFDCVIIFKTFGYLFKKPPVY
jgi:O-antigen biosynthesis protein WbqP